MPAYDYKCQDCGAEFEIRMSIASYSEGVTPECTVCGSKRTERSFGGITVLTSGRGGAASSPSCGPTGFG